MKDSTPIPPHTSEGSPQQSEVQDTNVTKEEGSASLESFRIIYNSMEAFHIPPGYERRFLRMNSVEELVVVSFGTLTEPFGADDPCWTTDIVRIPPPIV